MNRKKCWRFYLFGAGGLLTILGVTLTLATVAARHGQAGVFPWEGCRSHGCDDSGCGVVYQFSGEPGGTWYWVRSPDEERRVIIGLYNRYCIRCHGVDGRG